MTVGLLTIESALSAATRVLAAIGIEAARAEARLLLSHVLGLPREALLRDSRQPLERAAARQFDRLIERRAKHEPIAYLTGRREFWSLDFEVTPATLIPRPESETLIEAALARIDSRQVPHRLLDLGTGTGCLLLALLSELPAAQGLGVDASEAALVVARRNARRLGLDGRADFVCGSWGAGLEGRFDLIVANPPYIAESDAPTLAPDVVSFEPKEALFAGPDGLAAYRTLAPDLARLLAPGGIAVVELGAGAAGAVAAVLATAGLTEISQYPDLAGIVRCSLWQAR
ncbi:MAG: peptide chain release factor N(5)-glutamine methyltransferase [Alphaproteobacteria bacterium]|nr:peptide chain release factor N(5)-glutamine methyltransferase [Alphaproteobacteria bacterium]